MLNDVIGYTSFQALLDIHLLPTAPSVLPRLLSIVFWITMSVVLGYGIGLLTALLCKYTGNHGEPEDDRDSEIDRTLYSTDFAVMFLSPWIAYLIAEAFDMSAILTIFFCGLSLGQYAIYNLSQGCRQVASPDAVYLEDLRSHLRDLRVDILHLHRSRLLRLRHRKRRQQTLRLRLGCLHPLDRHLRPSCQRRHLLRPPATLLQDDRPSQPPDPHRRLRPARRHE